VISTDGETGCEIQIVSLVRTTYPNEVTPEYLNRIQLRKKCFVLGRPDAFKHKSQAQWSNLVLEGDAQIDNFVSLYKIVRALMEEKSA